MINFQSGKFIREASWQFLPPLGYFFWMLGYFPYWDMFWIYYDEGYNLIKALLLARGFGLYSEIWSDQPPLLTHLLAILFRFNGPGVYASRVLILLISCLMIWAVVQFMRLAWGNTAAIFALLFLILTPAFVLLSASVLVGLPAIAMVCVSMFFLAVWHKQHRVLWLAVSAIFMSLSLLFKLFTIFLIPIFIGGILLSDRIEAKNKRWYLPAVIWVFVFSAVLLFGGMLLAGPESLLQLTQPHLEAYQTFSASDTRTNILPITYYLRPTWPILLLAVGGIFYTLKERRGLMFYPLAWAASALLILLNYAPVWSHHAPLVTIPAAMLAGGAAAGTLQRLIRLFSQQTILRNAAAPVLLGVIATSLVFIILSPQLVNQISAPDFIPAEDRNSSEKQIMRKINQYAEETNWMITDLPMFAFRTGISVPPELAVFSGKRFETGEITEAEIIEMVKNFGVEQILIGRFSLPELEQYLEEANYQLVLERNNETKLFIRADIWNQE